MAEQEDYGAVALSPPQKNTYPGSRGGRQDWLGHRETPTISIIFCCHSDSLSGEILAIATYLPTPQVV